MVMERQVISAERFFDMVDSPEYEDRSVELVEVEAIRIAWADCYARRRKDFQLCYRQHAGHRHCG